MNPCRIHLMGICGSGMRSLALWLTAKGFSVTGCDLNPPDDSDELREKGIRILQGHDPDHVTETDALVFSAAIPGDHLEIQAALDAGLTVMRRSEALAELANDTTMLAIAGTHGKTTTTAMTGWILQQAGLNPTVMVGGRVTAWGGNYREGSGISVVEADEYDRTFLRLRPFSAGITSLSPEHLECYGSPEALSMAFGVFLEMIAPGGTAVVPQKLLYLAKWAGRIGRSILSTGPSGDIFCESVSIGSWSQKYRIGSIEGILDLPGEYNLRNAETALALTTTLGVPIEEAVVALETFPGVERRLEKLGYLGDSVALSDYAHHPDEVSAALKGLSAISGGSVGVVFQPHLYSRTASFASEFGKALCEAEWSIILPIFPAREKPLPGVTSELIVDAAIGRGADTSFSLPEDLVLNLRDRKADYIVFMGAGSIDGIARDLMNRGSNEIR